jgi:hypothetical protein
MLFERDSPARHPWRGGGFPPVLVAGPATLQQCKKEQSFIRRQKAQKAHKNSAGSFCAFCAANFWCSTPNTSFSDEKP